jgi:putative two-component system response regulator
LGARLGLADDLVVALNRGGFLHDVGKIGIPDAVLLKAGRLTASEYELIQQHTVIGDRLCSELRLLEDVRPIVRHHHERRMELGILISSKARTSHCSRGFSVSWMSTTP